MKKPSLYPPREAGCWICGNPYVEAHHIFPSARRNASDREGCVVMLCHYHHQGKGGVHRDRELDLEIKRDCQRRWERREGVEDDPEHNAFRDIFYASYL